MSPHEIKSTENLDSATIVALCEGMLTKMEEPEMRRMRRADQDRYLRTLKTQFKRLEDRYPGMFNLIMEYGRTTPTGDNVMARIKQMIGFRDAIDTGAITKDKADEEIDYEYARKFIRPAIGPAQFDAIVKPPAERERKDEPQRENKE